MEKYHVVPDVIPKVPKNLLHVKYGDLNVEQGNELTPMQVQNKPNVTWNAEQGIYYTLIMTDSDPPPIYKVRDFPHWLVVNIPGDRLQEGETLLDYVGAMPSEGSQLHRYVFLIFKQSGKIPKSQYENIKDDKIEDRLTYYSLSGLLQQLQSDIESVVAGNFFRAQYDENVPKLRTERMAKYNPH